jgi:hypothetical protein
VVLGAGGSSLAALLRDDVGRFGGSVSGTITGVRTVGDGVDAATGTDIGGGMIEVLLGRLFAAVGIGSGFFTPSFFAAIFLGSLTGGRIGADGFLGETAAEGIIVPSIGSSIGVKALTDSADTDGVLSGGNIGVERLEALGIGTGTGVSVLLLFGAGWLLPF